MDGVAPGLSRLGRRCGRFVPGLDWSRLRGGCGDFVVGRWLRCRPCGDGLRLRLRLGRCGYGFRRFAFRGSFEHRRWFDRGSRERCGFRGRFFRLRRGLGHEEGGRRQEIEHLAAICGNVRCAIALAALGTVAPAATTPAASATATTVVALAIFACNNRLRLFRRIAVIRLCGLASAVFPATAAAATTAATASAAVAVAIAILVFRVRAGLFF